MFKFIKKLFTPKQQKDEHLELFEEFPISDIKMFDEQSIDKTFENETKKPKTKETKETKSSSTFGV
tara:strand:+ start:291 stop:488 length:198 start_codon:yes stop_codon:yes gene_type:complete